MKKILIFLGLLVGIAICSELGTYIGKYGLSLYGGEGSVGQRYGNGNGTILLSYLLLIPDFSGLMLYEYLPESITEAPYAVGALVEYTISACCWLLLWLLWKWQDSWDIEFFWDERQATRSIIFGLLGGTISWILMALIAGIVIGLIITIGCMIQFEAITALTNKRSPTKNPS